MLYEASLVQQGKSLLSRQGDNSNQLLAWLLVQLEEKHCPDMMGIIKDTTNTQKAPRVYTAHNAHID